MATTVVPIATILALVVTYIVIAVLLLSMNLTSRWRWWIKAGAIVVTGAFFVVSYFAIVSVLGWASHDQPPERFSLIASRVVDPDKVTGAPGAVYLWIEELDDNNVPNGLPRSYIIPYTSDLAVQVQKAQDMLDNGEDVEGGVKLDPLQAEDILAGNPADLANRQSGTGYEGMGQVLEFTDLPPVRLPDKAIL